MTIIEALTNDWQTMAEIERRLGRPARGLHVLVADRKIWRMIDYSAADDLPVVKYCLPHDVGDPLIGTGHVARCAACPYQEAAE